MNKSGKINKNIKKAILEGIRKIKGKDITLIDLNTIKHTECGFFIICHGNSTTQVSSIAHSVEEKMEEMAGEKALHTEGYKNSVWILLDFGDVVVHVFDGVLAADAVDVGGFFPAAPNEVQILRRFRCKANIR